MRYTRADNAVWLASARCCWKETAGGRLSRLRRSRLTRLLPEVLCAWLFSRGSAGAWELTASRQIIVWKVIRLARGRATALDAILSVLRDCERTGSTPGWICANYGSRAR